MIIEKEFKSLIEEKVHIKIKIYDSAQECLEAHWGCKFSEVTEMGGYDGKGKKYHFTPEQVLENVIESGCWGFCVDKSEIHLWCSKECDLANLIHLLAHERGHMLEPQHKTAKREEIKAEKYGDTARFAYEVATQLLNRESRKESPSSGGGA